MAGTEAASEAVLAVAVFQCTVFFGDAEDRARLVVLLEIVLDALYEGFAHFEIAEAEVRACYVGLAFAFVQRIPFWMLFSIFCLWQEEQFRVPVVWLEGRE